MPVVGKVLSWNIAIAFDHCRFYALRKNMAWQMVYFCMVFVLEKFDTLSKISDL